MTNPNPPRFRCQKLKPKLFFSYVSADMAKAKEACNGITEAAQEPCPVRTACRDYARMSGEWGIWGGEDENERRDAGYPPRYKRQDELEDGGAHTLDLEDKPVVLVPVRKKKVTRSRGEVQPCGTPAAARRHRARGETLCWACQEALRLKKEEDRRAKGVKPKQKIAKCGTRSGTQRHRRLGEVVCEACLTAERAYDQGRERNRSKKAATA